MLDVLKVVTGFLEENCYIVNNGVDALIIDPGSEANKIIDTIKKHNLNVIGILITHYHFDHVGVLDEIKKEYPNAKLVDYKNKGNNVIGPFNFKVIQTFGHTLDSASYYFDENEMLFSGDFIFKGTIGNFDEDNEDIMINSLSTFKYMPLNVEIYPGHGEKTNVEEEKNNNPFLRGI